MIQKMIRFTKKENIARKGMAVAAQGPLELVTGLTASDVGTLAHSSPRLEPLHSLAKRPGGYDP